MLSLKEHLSHKRHIIWDWNGTLLDDVDLVVEIMARILEEHALPPLTRERYLELFGFPVADYYRKLGFDFEKTPFHEVSDQFIGTYSRAVLGCDLHAGAVSLLRELQAAGFEQSVLSAAHEGSLREQLAHYGILDCFGRVYGLSNSHAAGKIARGRELLADSGISPEEAILVGDTDHDLEVGQALGVDVLLLSHGHQAPSRLEALPVKVFLRGGPGNG